MMRFDGLQKTTLLDYPGKVACTVFLGGCNLRCPFCHNASLVLTPTQSIDAAEILAFLKRRQGILDGVCVTGGEPLLQAGLADFLGRVRDLGFAVKLDTNGAFPSRLRTLTEAGLLDYVAMDIKNALPRYAETVGVSGFDTGPIVESAAFLLEGRLDYEFRTTVVRQIHDAESFCSISQWLEGAKRYFLQNFVDSGDLLSDGLSAWDAGMLEQFRAICAEKMEYVGLRGV